MLLNREYVILDSRRFKPTDVGRAVAKFLSGHFAQYVDYDFTAKLEDELDAVSRGEEDWVPLLEKFWKPFKALVDDKNETRRSLRSDRRARARHRSEERQAGAGAPRPLWAVRADRHQGRRGQAEVREPASRPEHAHDLAAPMRWSCSSCRAISARRDDGEDITVGVGRFGPFVKHGATYASLQPTTIRTRSSWRARSS